MTFIAAHETADPSSASSPSHRPLGQRFQYQPAWKPILAKEGFVADPKGHLSRVESFSDENTDALSRSRQIGSGSFHDAYEKDGVVTKIPSTNSFRMLPEIYEAALSRQIIILKDLRRFLKERKEEGLYPDIDLAQIGAKKLDHVEFNVQASYFIPGKRPSRDELPHLKDEFQKLWKDYVTSTMGISPEVFDSQYSKGVLDCNRGNIILTTRKQAVHIDPGFLEATVLFGDGQISLLNQLTERICAQRSISPDRPPLLSPLTIPAPFSPTTAFAPPPTPKARYAGASSSPSVSA